MSKPRVAIVEDEHSLRTDLSEYLTVCGFETQAHASAESFYAAFDRQACDIVLLDIGLPGDSGLQVAHWIRQRRDVGIVMLTAFKDPHDQVTGLAAGADAYLIKNTPMEVIAATCHSVLRRLGRSGSATGLGLLESDPHESARLWRLWPSRWALAVPGAGELTLTHTEVNFLQPLMQQPGQAVSRSELLLALGKPDTFSNSRNLENYASRLRRKVQEHGRTELPLRPSYNQGYTFAASARVEPA